MNIIWIWKIAKYNKALARAINIGIISASSMFISLLIWYLTTWETINTNIVIITFLIPVLSWIDKISRDLNNKK